MAEFATRLGDVLIDDADLAVVAGHTLHAVTSRDRRYALIYRDGTSRRLHRVLTGAPAGMDVDHINGNGLDNRRANLRVCSRALNARNMRKSLRRPGSSQFKGVQLVQGKYTARIRVAGRVLWLGAHSDEEAAARAYDDAAREHYGEFACLNFANIGEQSALDRQPFHAARHNPGDAS